MADSAVLRDKPVISPGNVPASKWTLPRIYKIKNSHDTKPCFGGLSPQREPSLLMREVKPHLPGTLET